MYICTVGNFNLPTHCYFSPCLHFPISYLEMKPNILRNSTTQPEGILFLNHSYRIHGNASTFVVPNNAH